MRLLGLLLWAFGAAEDFSGSALVLNKTDGTVWRIDLRTGSVQTTWQLGEGPHEVLLSSDGRWAVVALYGTAQQPGSALAVLDLGGQEPIRRIELAPYSRPHGLAWWGRDTLLVTAEAQARLLLVSFSQGRVLGAIPTEARLSHMVAADPSRGRAFTANIGSGSISALEVRSGRFLAQVPTGAGAEGIALRPGARELWVTNRAAHTISILDPDGLHVLDSLPCPGFPIRIAFTPDGSRALVSCAESGEVAVFEAASRRLLGRVRIPAPESDVPPGRLFGSRFGKSPVPIGLALSPDGRYALVAASYADRVHVITLDALRLVASFRTGQEPDGIAWAP
ncbi:MAG: YncE family protein [Bacteroidetes bacterium]|nr:YncE family protein [Bacteroidota bacterium]